MCTLITGAILGPAILCDVKITSNQERIRR
jgi:hypothetical protein